MRPNEPAEIAFATMLRRLRLETAAVTLEESGFAVDSAVCMHIDPLKSEDPRINRRLI
jgi:hypothetical protein